MIDVTPNVIKRARVNKIFGVQGFTSESLSSFCKSLLSNFEAASTIKNQKIKYFTILFNLIKRLLKLLTYTLVSYFFQNVTLIKLNLVKVKVCLM